MQSPCKPDCLYDLILSNVEAGHNSNGAIRYEEKLDGMLRLQDKLRGIFIT